jgi:type IV secretion system protein TrbL
VVRKRNPLTAVCTLAVIGVMLSTPGHAQSADVLDQIVAQFQARSAGWEGTLRGFAMGTFGILAAVEMGWAAFRLAFRGADVSEWLAEVVNQILFLGFFLALLQNSVTWGQTIVNSFRQAASSAGGGGIAPSDVFAAGVKIAAMVLSQMSFWHPEASAGLIVAGIVIEVCFALMAALMVLALVESFLIISMGVLFMAFGGSRWTKEMAVSTVRYTVSVGAKLFVLQLLVSIGTGLIQDWANSFTDVTDASLCILIGCSIVMLALVKVLPETRCSAL